MGASVYWYLVPFEQDYNSALQKLRVREFSAGRYNSVIPFPTFPVTETSESPGAQHSSIEDPLNESEGEGTRSILDILSVSHEDDFCVARILTSAELVKYFGTDKPELTHLVEQERYYEDIERGKAFCIPVFRNGEPDELFFIGYSFD